MTKGIYAKQEGNTLELVNVPCSTTQAKKMRREMKRRGVRLYVNY